MNSRNYLTYLVFFFIIGCNPEGTNKDPCIHNFNEDFPQKILEEFSNIIDAKIYSYPKVDKTNKSFDINNRSNIVGCEELILELEYDYDVNIATEESIEKSVNLFRKDSLNKIKQLNLRIISELPTRDDTYIKKKIEAFSIIPDDSLSCELIQSNFIKDSFSYSLIKEYQDEILLRGDWKIKKFSKVIFSFNTNVELLDDMAQVIKKGFEDNVRKDELIIVLIKIEQPNYYRINGKENQFVFSSYEYIFKE